MHRVSSSRRWAHGLALLMSLSPGVWAANDGPVTVVAQVQIASGPNTGTYAYDSKDACVIATIEDGQPPGFSVALVSDRSTLAIDIPSVDPAQLGEVKIEVVVADTKSSQSRQTAASTKYVIDTRPDAVLSSFQRDERGSSGVTGKATIQLTQDTATAKLKFSGETAAGVKIEGTVDCKKVDRAYGG